MEYQKSFSNIREDSYLTDFIPWTIKTITAKYIDPKSHEEQLVELAIPKPNMAGESAADSAESEITPGGENESISFTVVVTHGYGDIYCEGLDEVTLSFVEYEDNAAQKESLSTNNNSHKSDLVEHSLEISEEFDTQMTLEEYRNIDYELKNIITATQVRTLISDLEDESIEFPHYQRAFVWNIKKASLLVDTILKELFMPPLIFLESKEKKMELVDGQQRLLTMYLFFKGIFPKNVREFKTVSELIKAIKNYQQGDNKFIPFKLINKELGKHKGISYSDLDAKDSTNPKLKMRFDKYIVPTVQIIQTSPQDTANPLIAKLSAYEIFYRINTGATNLSRQEIRTALTRKSDNSFAELVTKLAQKLNWNELINRTSNRKASEELVLRFFALLYSCETKDNILYTSPMSTYLDMTWEKNIHPNKNVSGYEKYPTLPAIKNLDEIFSKTIEVVYNAFPNKNFPWISKTSFSLVKFDIILIGCAYLLLKNSHVTSAKVSEVWETISQFSKEEQDAVKLNDTRYSSHTQNINLRLKKSIELYEG